MKYIENPNYSMLDNIAWELYMVYIKKEKKTTHAAQWWFKKYPEQYTRFYNGDKIILRDIKIDKIKSSIYLKNE